MGNIRRSLESLSMNFWFRRIGGQSLLVLAGMSLLACGGSGGGGEGGKSAPTYAVGGTLAGLASGTVVLSSGVDSVQITVSDGVVQDRPFQIASLPTGAAYNLRVDQQPAGVSCAVVNGASVVGATPVSDIKVLCVNIKLLALVAGVLPSYGAQDGVGNLAGFNNPGVMRADAAGNLYVADANAIRKVTPSRIVTTLAGRTLVPGYVEGAGQEARFSDLLNGIAVDGSGNVYVSDSGNKAVRRITAEGVVSTVLKEERFPLGPIGVDGSGNIYLLAGGRAVVKYTPAGQSTVLAGDLNFQLDPQTFRPFPTGFLGGKLASAIALDAAGNVYIGGSRSPNNHDMAWSLDKVAPDGQVSRVVMGRLENDFSCPLRPYDPLEGLVDIAAGQNGDVWVTRSIVDFCRAPPPTDKQILSKLTRLDALGVVQTEVDVDVPDRLGALAWNPGGDIFFVYSRDILKWSESAGVKAFVGPELPATYVDGPATSARFNKISGFSLLDDGSVIVSDIGLNRAIRKISPDGDVTTLFLSEFTKASGVDFFPFDLTTAVDAAQGVYFRYDCGLKRVDPGGGVTTLFDPGNCGAVDGPPGVGQLMESLVFFATRSGIASDSAGNIVVWDSTCMRRISGGGTVSNLAGNCLQAGDVDAIGQSARFAAIQAVATLPNGEFLVLDSQKLKRVGADGTVITLQSAAQSVFGLAGDGRGNVGVVLDDGIYWFSGTSFDRRTRIIDYGPRTVLGPLPTSIEERPGAIAIGNGKLFISVKNSVFAVDL